jgi:hypothetical protein
MNKETLIKLAGSQKKLAELLNVTQPAIAQWKTIPESRIWQLKLIKPEWFSSENQDRIA